MMMKYAKIFLVLVVAAGFGSCVSVPTGPVVTYLPEPVEYRDIDDAYAAGLDYLREGDANAAIESFRSSAVGDEFLFTGFGYAYLLKRDYATARRNFERALALNPLNKDARIGLALLQESTATREELLEIYTQLQARYPEDPWIGSRLERIRAEGREYYLEQADKIEGDQQRETEYISRLEKAEQFGGEADPINLQIARFYRNRNEIPTAIRYLEKYVGDNLQDIAAMEELAHLYERIEKYDQSLLIYRKIQNLQPENLVWQDRINEIKTLLYDSDLPQKFKNIFFKKAINREDLAALVGHYFQDYLMIQGAPVIISDIGDSFARTHIIKVCSNGIMRLKPDHSFDRYREVDRADFCTVLHNLIDYLENKGYDLNLRVRRNLIRPTDISPEHRNYSTILLLVNLGIMELDSRERFNPTLPVRPYEALAALKKIFNEIDR